MRAQLSTHDYEQLSAYLDGQLASGERNKLEARLKTRPELQTALEDLRQTRALLRMAPRKRAPRNFTLTPAMIGDMGPARNKKRGWGGFNLFPALSFASAMAALLLVAVILFDLGANRATMTAQSEQPRAAAPAVAQNLPTLPVQATLLTGAGGASAQQKSTLSTPATAVTDNSAAGQSVPAPEATAQPPAMTAKAQGSDIPGGQINWYAATGRGGGGPGQGGAGSGGGGGPDPRAAIIQQYGVGGSSDGSLSLPPQSLQSLNSLNATQPAAPSGEAAVQPAQPNPQISGTGPILGVPSQDQAGKVTGEQSIMGNPGQVTPGPTELPAEPTPYLSSQPYPAAGANESFQVPWYERIVAGLPALRLVEGGLLALALATGVAALIAWRRRAAP